jgi:hypothetical protein
MKRNRKVDTFLIPNAVLYIVWRIGSTGHIENQKKIMDSHRVNLKVKTEFEMERILL